MTIFVSTDLALVRIIRLDVAHMVFGQLVNGRLNLLDASLSESLLLSNIPIASPAHLDPHSFGREVSVGPGTVPVPRHRLGVE